MPEINESLITDGWVSSCGQGFDFPPPEFYSLFKSDPRRTRAGQLRSPNNGWVAEGQDGWDEAFRAWRQANPDIQLSVENGRLVAQLINGRRRLPQIELGRYLGKRGDENSLWLLNGDGFDSQHLQNVQTRIRGMIEEHGRTFHGVRARHRGRLIIPYQALTAAQLDLDSIRPIHITRDGTVSTTREVPKPPKKQLDENIPTGGMRNVSSTTTASTMTVDVGTGAGPTFTPTASIARQERDTRRSFVHAGRQYTAERWNENYPVQYQIMHQAEFADRPRPHVIREDRETGKWMVTESVHRLGASVFSAVGPDGKRHRWISAFDQNERPAMYFLAQLPDKGTARFYGHAIKLLAPPIVHKAREHDKRVFRQGDIFAIETDLTDEKLNNAGAKITCRQEIFDHSVSVDGNAITNQQIDLMPGARAMWRTRRSLQIYGTSHTATWVAVKPDNTTFVKGVMFHDPILENLRAGREPEHRPVELLPDRWFLCVRNTVPRQPVITQTNISERINQ